MLLVSIVIRQICGIVGYTGTSRLSRHNKRMFTRSVVLGVCLVVASAACSKSPTAPTPAPAGAPVLTTPTNGAQIPNQGQPVTLVVLNASGSAAGTTYTFEVASDIGFTTKVQTKDGVPAGITGQTSAQLDPLPAQKDYYWRARAQAPGAAGTFSDPFRFTIGGSITLGAPLPIGPLTNAETSSRPVLRVSNANRTGPTGPISYRFEIASDSGFAAPLVIGSNGEGINETGFTPTADLPMGNRLFWRAFAIDAANAVTSPSSTVQSFTPMPSQAEAVAQRLGVALWPGIKPPGTTGQATMGDNWQIQTLHYLPANVYFQSPDIEMLRIFDLLDRGFDPDGAAAWMNSNGYPTAALWYPPPEKAVIGLKYVYLASRNKVFVNGTWEIVLRVE
jgi:hypothetical protein